ncbi:MAG: DivIVA domain-containing protein [Nitrospinota bacterium]|nr:DivIVA domain-containing protein [Nitrospinota bacterium]
MRLDYEGILQQTFKDSFRGYHKEEVQDFLQLVANDFKEMKRDVVTLQEELNERDQRIRQLEEALTQSKSQHTASFENMRSALKEKARKFVDQARDQADRHKRKVEAELSHLQDDIRRLKKEKEHLLENFQSAAQSYINSRNK